MNQSIIDIKAINKSVGVDLKKVLLIMREKEKERREELKPLQDKKKRELVIDYILETIDKFCLHMSTAFVAIDYFDRIAQDFSPSSNVQAKLGVTCLLLACKLEECEINIPSFSYFCGSSNRLFSSIDELHNYERNVLDVLHWNMNSITVAHYVDIFTVTGILYKDDIYEHHPIMETTVRYVKEFMGFFLSLSLVQSDFSLYLPSIQATAIVYATRKATHIQPVWREELEELTGMSLKESYECFEILWKVFEERYPSYHQKQHEESPTNVTVI